MKVQIFLLYFSFSLASCFEGDTSKTTASKLIVNDFDIKNLSDLHSNLSSQSGSIYSEEALAEYRMLAAKRSTTRLIYTPMRVEGDCEDDPVIPVPSSGNATLTSEAIHKQN